MNKYKIGKYIVKADSICTAVSIVRQIKDTSDDFDKDYARESRALENDVEKAYEDYNRLGNKSASELFKTMGYKEDGHKYYKTNGSYTRVIVFNDFDDIKYYVLKDGVIPSGWTWTRTKWYDSMKDQRVFGFGNFPYEYWLKNNDGAWFLAAFSKKKYDRSEIEALRKKYMLKNGKLPDYQEKIVDSVKDGKYVSELKPGDVITKKDGSKWDVVLVRHTPFGIQVRMNSKTSPVKTEEITYRPTDMLAHDSVKDSVTVRDIIQSLVTEETSAISSYNVALETLKDHIPAEAYEAIKAIRDDEQRHVENLCAVLNGNVTPKNLEN